MALNQNFKGRPIEKPITEFALRVIHVCDAMTPKQLEEYFGFGQLEIAAVI
jgi:hypothetical protein